MWPRDEFLKDMWQPPTNCHCGQGGLAKYRFLSLGSSGTWQKALLFKRNMEDYISLKACHAETSNTKQLTEAWRHIQLHLDYRAVIGRGRLRCCEYFCNDHGHQCSQFLLRKGACLGGQRTVEEMYLCHSMASFAKRFFLPFLGSICPRNYKNMVNKKKELKGNILPEKINIIE